MAKTRREYVSVAAVVVNANGFPLWGEKQGTRERLKKQ